MPFVSQKLYLFASFVPVSKELPSEFPFTDAISSHLFLPSNPSKGSHPLPLGFTFCFPPIHSCAHFLSLPFSIPCYFPAILVPASNCAPYHHRNHFIIPSDASSVRLLLRLSTTKHQRFYMVGSGEAGLSLL